MDDYISEPSFSLWRRWKIGLHVALSVFAAFALTGMINYLGHKHTTRLYLSKAASLKLSPLTEQVLNSLTNDLKVIVFFNRRDPLFGPVSGMIREYEARNSRLEVEFVDYRMPGRAEAIRNQYKFSSGSDSSRVIFDCGGKVRTVLATELSDFAVTSEREIVRSGFRGEQMFTSAILNVTRNKPLIAYFLQGHGEHDPFSEDDQRGYSLFTRLLENNNITVRALPPLAGMDVPPDCDMLIIASPDQAFSEDELSRIERYLDRGGRLWALFSAGSLGVRTGLEKLLLNWNIEVGLNWVQDVKQGQAGESGVLVVSDFGAHPIVKPLLRSSLKMVAPRSIAQRKGAARTADAPKVAELAYTSDQGRAIVPVERKWVEQGRGVIPLVAAAERGGIQGVATDRGAARILVCGDSLFLSNLAFGQAANAAFATLALNWLAHRDTLLTEIGPSPVTEYEVLLTQVQMDRLRWLFLGVLPGTVFVIGLLVWVRRRV